MQLHACPGFVDLVEDAFDRYVLERLDAHTANRALLMLARGFGNPTRTFANLMALRILGGVTPGRVCLKRALSLAPSGFRAVSKRWVRMVPCS